MANRAVSKVFMIGPFCGEGLYNRVAWAGDVRERVRRFASYLLSKRSQKGKNVTKPGPCNSRKKQRFVLLSRTTSPVESRLTVESHRTGCATRNGGMAKRRRQLGAGNASLYGATTLGTRIFKHAPKRRLARGFSLVELLVSV